MFLFGPWEAPAWLRCPEGHHGDFTQYGLGIYSCHTCSTNHKFYVREGKSYWA